MMISKSNIFSLVLVATISFTICSCQHSSKQSQDDIAKSETINNDSNEPLISNPEISQVDTIHFLNHTYQIELHKYPDKSDNIIKDRSGYQYYDNKVNVTIKEDNQRIFQRTFTKKDFQTYIAEKEYPIQVLHGMAIIKEGNNKKIQLGAEVGEPGLDGEGYFFLIEVDKQGNYIIKKIDNPPIVEPI